MLLSRGTLKRRSQPGALDGSARHSGRAASGTATVCSRPLANYWPAEDYHQHYFARNPGQGYCAFVVAPKVEKFRKTFRAKLRA